MAQFFLTYTFRILLFFVSAFSLNASIATPLENALNHASSNVEQSFVSHHSALGSRLCFLCYQKKQNLDYRFTTSNLPHLNKEIHQSKTEYQFKQLVQLKEQRLIYKSVKSMDLFYLLTHQTADQLSEPFQLS